MKYNTPCLASESNEGANIVLFRLINSSLHMAQIYIMVDIPRNQGTGVKTNVQLAQATKSSQLTSLAQVRYGNLHVVA